MNLTMIAKEVYGSENVINRNKLKTINEYICKSNNREIDKTKFIIKLNKYNIPFIEYYKGRHGIKIIEINDGISITRFYFKYLKPTGENKTEIQESAQIYMCQYLNNNPFINYDNINLFDFQKCFPAGIVNLEKVITLLLNESWRKSIYYTGIAINSYLKDNEYIFHRKSSLVQSIYLKFKQLNKNNISVANDKWNPSDIWAIVKGFKPKFNQRTIEELNEYIYELICDKKLVGISLKKLDENYNPTIEEFNISKFEDIEIKNMKYVYGQESYKLFRSKDSYVKADEIKLQFRSHIPKFSVVGEFVGKVARFGKIGFTPTVNIMEIKKPKYIKEINNNSYKLLLEELERQNDSDKKLDVVDEQEIHFQLKLLKENIRIDRLNSKYQSMYIVNRIKEEDLKNMYLYAICRPNKLINPSAFIKIS